MALSDVRAVFITADTVALDADGISVAAAVGEDAALVIGGALASGGSCTFNAGRIVTILSAGDDSGISFTVTGTDVNSDSQTESITGANAGTATGAKYFLTISGISAVGNPAGNVSAGVNASAGNVIFAGRSLRLLYREMSLFPMKVLCLAMVSMCNIRLPPLLI